MKHAVAVLTPYWGNTLTQLERDAWNLYGANVTMTNVLGQPFRLTGQNHFLRTNIPRLQSGISVLETAPTVFDLGTFTAPTILAATEAGSIIGIAFNAFDHWADTVGGFMVCYGGRPTGQGQDFFGGPFRLGGKFDGGPGPPFSPFLMPSQWPLSVGQRVWAHIRIIQVDGRMSLPITLGPATVIP